MRWLHTLTQITYLSKLIGILVFAAFLQLELFWVSTPLSTGGVLLLITDVFHPQRSAIFASLIALA